MAPDDVHDLADDSLDRQLADDQVQVDPRPLSQILDEYSRSSSLDSLDSLDGDDFVDPPCPADSRGSAP